MEETGTHIMPSNIGNRLCARIEGIIRRGLSSQPVFVLGIRTYAYNGHRVQSA